MEDLYIPPTNETPEIHFAFSDNTLHISGESYPENAMSFYGPLRASLDRYLAGSAASGHGLEAHFALKYFNSSSTKLIRMLIAMLHTAASAGRSVVAHWYHDPDDDMMMEFGMDLREEFRMMEVRVVALAAA